jgi:serine/threonine-protein kinase
VAVLPFTTSDPELQYLGDGITEGLINALSRLPNLRVIARTTAFRYKGQDADPGKTGRDLNVRTVLTGRLIQSRGTLRIQAELASAADGSQIWGQRYERQTSEIAVVEDEIARDISAKLAGEVASGSKRLLATRYAPAAEAYRLYLHGRYYWNKYNEEGTKKSIQYFRQAMDISPDYALASVGLADAYAQMSNLFMPPHEAMPRARAAAKRALELDVSLAEAHSSLADIASGYDWEWTTAESEYRKAIQLNPGYAPAHHGYGILLVLQGRFAEGRIELNKAWELDPLSDSIAVTAVWPDLYGRRYGAAIDHLRKLIRLSPGFDRAHLALGLAYEHNRQFAEAETEYKKTLELLDNDVVRSHLARLYAVSGQTGAATAMVQKLEASPGWICSVSIAAIHAGLGDRNKAFDWLEKAYRDRDQELAIIKVDPWLDSLRSDPRFDTLLRKMKLVP